MTSNPTKVVNRDHEKDACLVSMIVGHDQIVEAIMIQVRSRHLAGQALVHTFRRPKPGVGRMQFKMTIAATQEDF